MNMTITTKKVSISAGNCQDFQRNAENIAKAELIVKDRNRQTKEKEKQIQKQELEDLYQRNKKKWVHKERENWHHFVPYTTVTNTGNKLTRFNVLITLSSL